MRRRTLLALGGVTLATGLSGCVGDSTGASGTDDTHNGTDESVPEYADQLEECNLISMQYNSVPEEIQAEIDTAIEDGPYESDLLLFDRAVNTRESSIVKDGTPYEPTVESDGESKRLELTEVDAVRMPEPYRVSVENDDDREYTVGLRLESGDGELKLDSEVLVPAEDGVRSIETEAQEFGTYTLTGELVDEESNESNTLRIGDAYKSPFEARISDGELRVTQVVAELVPCPHTEFA